MSIKTAIMKNLLFFILLISPYLIFGQNWQQIGPEGGYFKEVFNSPKQF